MRIAVTYDNGEVFQHFGHTESFKVYEIKDNEIVTSNVFSTNGQGHGALATFLSNLNVDTLICGGIGTGARSALADCNITLYCGVTGNADEAVKALLSENLSYNPDVVCNHHEHDENHKCGDHGCGEHKCGH